VWIHGRTRGSVNTSVQMEHSVISYSSLLGDDERAILLRIVLPVQVATLQCQQVNVGNFIRNESETEAVASSNRV